MSAPSLCAINDIPDGLSSATTYSNIDNQSLSTLFDTGSARNFISKPAADLCKLKVVPNEMEVHMADPSHKSRCVGHCEVDITVNGVKYTGILLFVFEQLCCDIILGLQFQKLHRRTIFEFGGAKSDLLISDQSICAVAASKSKAKSIFSNLTKDCHPIRVKSRRFNKADREFIAKEVHRMHSHKIVGPSSSPWRTQPVIVKKMGEDGLITRRFCCDFSQTINLFTELDAYPLPLIEDLVNKLSEFKYFSKFDLKSAYHQIELLESDRKYTAFEADGKLWEFLRLPFGVTNGVPAQQRVMDTLVEEENLAATYPYLDDVIVGGHTREELDLNVKSFLQAAHKNNMTLNDHKTVSAVEAIDFLGYRISFGNIAPDPERLRPLKEFPPPNNQGALKRALGLFAYYSKWVPNFADKTEKLRCTKSFPLDKPALKEFHSVKKEIEAATLHSIDENLPFVVECDASDVAISATLNQGAKVVLKGLRSFPFTKVMTNKT